MIVYKVTNGKNRGFTESVFVSTTAGVFVEMPSDGFFKHPTFDQKLLEEHLKNLKSEGFKIEKRTFTVNAF